MESTGDSATPRGQVPLVILLYGFDKKFAAGGQWVNAYPVQKLIDAGIDVLLLNFPMEHDWRVGDAQAARFEFLQDPLATVEAAPDAVRRTGIDVGKTMLLGWSQGGFIAAHAIERSCEFVAVEVGDPAMWDVTSYALNGEYWRQYMADIFGGPPVKRYIDNYLAFDPVAAGNRPYGPVMLEFAGRHPGVGQDLEEWRAVGGYIEAFAYHYSVHALDVPAEAEASRARNYAWALLNLRGRNTVPANRLAELGLSVPPRSSYRCK